MTNRDMEEIKEIINCDADAETKCKMISNILNAKPHYFEPKTGHWNWYSTEIRCSNCNYKLETTGIPSRCPNCEINMEGRI